MILDANNEVLAHNIPVETVVADATLLSDVQATVNLLNTELEIPSQEVAEKLNSGRRYIVIKREVSAARANALPKNFARAICAESSSSTTPRASTPTARCFAT